MRVLILDEWLPVPMDSGKRLRSYQLLRRLARSHELTWLAPEPGPGEGGEAARGAMEADGFRVETVRAPVLKRSDPRFYLGALGSVLSKVPYVVTLHRARAIERRLTELHARHRFDLLHVEWTPLSANLPAHWDRPWVVDAHNLESRIWGRLSSVATAPYLRMFYGLEASRMARFEADAFRRASAVVAVSDLERTEIENLGGRAFTVENGVDLEGLRASAGEGEPTLVFTGALDWHANIDAVEHFVRDLWPGIRAGHAGWKFQAVGRSPGAEWKARMEAEPGVEIHGSVPDIRPYLDRAAIVVVPLRAGGGTRLKILEALSMEKAVVSTRVGAEGLEIIAGEDYVVAETPAEWSEAIGELASDTALRRRMGACGRRRIEPRYGWDGLAHKLERVWQAACGGGGA